MILMLDEAFVNPRAQAKYEGFISAMSARKILQDKLHIDMSLFSNNSFLNKLLHKCPWIEHKRFGGSPYYKKIAIENIGREDLNLRQKFEDIRNACLREYMHNDKHAFDELEAEKKGTTMPTSQSSISYPTIQNTPDELFQDETNMEYCNQQLLNKYQFENKKRTVKITESQLKNLINILT